LGSTPSDLRILSASLRTAGIVDLRERALIMPSN
jgi:hypothetical protein